MCLSIILKIYFSFQVFKALDSACSRMHQRLQNYCKAPGTLSRHLAMKPITLRSFVDIRIKNNFEIPSNY